MRKTRRGPLHKVMREFWKTDVIGGLEMTRLFEELDCGHIIRKPQDFYGEYDSDKRRCTKCYEEKMKNE